MRTTPSASPSFGVVTELSCTSRTRAEALDHLRGLAKRRNLTLLTATTSRRDQ